LAYDVLLFLGISLAVELAEIGVMGVFWGSGEVGWPDGGVGGMVGIGCCPRFVLMGLRVAILILRPWLVCVVMVGRCTGCT
jgi:hypothetical protein